MCRARNPWTQRRHDAIDRSIHQYLNQINGAIVDIEPPTLTGQRRNDLRVRGTSSLAFTDYDLKVYSLGDSEARSTAVPIPPNINSPISASSGVLAGWIRLERLWRGERRGSSGVRGCIQASYFVNWRFDEPRNARRMEELEGNDARGNVPAVPEEN